MSKQIINIQLDGIIIGSKPLILNDSLASIREKINNKVNCPFIFLDKSIKKIIKENESELKLEDIINEKKIQIESLKPGINCLLNDKIICSIECSKNKNLVDVRKMINDKIKGDFIFLDSNAKTIDIEDEQDYLIEDISKNDEIKLNLKENISNSTSSNSDEDCKEILTKEKENKNKDIDFSKYEVLEKKENLTIYKYSNVKRQSGQKLVFQYFYDNFEGEDYNNAYVLLFCGKTGDGKTTAINAFFNIIKGVKLEDNYRFILIEEQEKEKKQAESQTDGVHLYYLRDYNNKPLIIIDSQGYGDTRGKQYDEMIDEAFRYVFSNLIDHINAALFIVKSNTSRLDILTKYIFSSVTSLFSEDISENFIILATFANKETISKGPDFIHSIETEEDFLNIKERMNDNWWYAFDSKCILDNDKDKLTLYSFEQAKELYKEKIMKLRSKGIKKSSEVLNSRNELRIEVNKLNDKFQDLIIEQDNLQRKDKNIDEVSDKIYEMELTISKLEKNMERKKPYELERELRILNEELNLKLMNLNNQVEIITRFQLKLDEKKNLYTVCHKCKRNCHMPCDCFLQSLGRCTIYTFFRKKCEKCGCKKEEHKQDYYFFDPETISLNKNTEEEKKKEQKIYEAKKKEYLNQMNKNYSEKNNLEKQKNELSYNKSILLEEKNKNTVEKINIQKKIGHINQDILFTIYNLQRISQKINDIAMNNNHLKTEDEYIEDLINKMDKMNLNDKEKIEKIKKIKENNNIFKKAVKLNRNELLNLSDKELSEKLKTLMTNI